jgi:sialate O-acetylesterase
MFTTARAVRWLVALSIPCVSACANRVSEPALPAPAAAPAVMTSATTAAPASSAEVAAPAPPANLPTVHPLFTDHMVLQRGVPAPVWGWTRPGSVVTVSVAGKSASATADASGRWLARVGPLGAGGPHTLTIDGPFHAEIHDVLVGDVWLCSGQSNMGFQVWSANDAKNEIARSADPELRLFTVPNNASTTPELLVHGNWQLSGPESVRWFSAVGYFFGRELRSKLHVPIGLIHSSWGGTIAEAWTSEEALAALPEFQERLADFRRQAELFASGNGQVFAEWDAWWQKYDEGTARSWQNTDVTDADWSTMPVPKFWEEAGLRDFDGVVWFRTTFDVAPSDAGKPARLTLGPIDDEDTTWIDGRLVGHTEGWTEPRIYDVPAGVLGAGKNVIAVRVLDTGGGGGFHGTAQDLELRVTGGATIPLGGSWRYHSTAAAEALQHRPAASAKDPNRVTVLYNAMIAPLVPFGIKGAIWYQGEANAGRAAEYRRLLPALIGDWRRRFGVGDFPFGIVQLANWLEPQKAPSEGGWAEIRESQLLASQSVPDTGLAVAIDVGEAKNIHPKDKQTVSHRLALWALGTTYGQAVEVSGPVYRSLEVKGSVAYLTFDHRGGGLVGKKGPLRGFAVAGADGQFQWASARIEGDRVAISSPKVPVPVAVRYDWASNPNGNLYNNDGLPAPPFRTDVPPLTP